MGDLEDKITISEIEEKAIKINRAFGEGKGKYRGRVYCSNFFFENENFVIQDKAEEFNGFSHLEITIKYRETVVYQRDQHTVDHHKGLWEQEFNQLYSKVEEYYDKCEKERKRLMRLVGEEKPNAQEVTNCLKFCAENTGVYAFETMKLLGKTDLSKGQLLGIGESLCKGAQKFKDHGNHDIFDELVHSRIYAEDKLEEIQST